MRVGIRHKINCKDEKFIINYNINFTFSINAQKLKLKNFILTDYEIEQNDNIYIKSFSIIDQKGNLKVYSDSYDGKNYFEYKLSTAEIEEINLLAKQSLESWIKQKQLKKNQFFAGSRRMIRFENNRKLESLCFIEPFMSEEFMNILKILNDKIYKHDSLAKIESFTVDFEKIKKEILKRNKIDSYLPDKAVITQVR